ncbi:hypothetical protein DUNSADRAFT_16208 [Dunaliella salina]|uniref:DNA ligase n=1 Tax=Dunaliella salina TaxID=3046 RepID=A0ABQ7G414_DUNSA|nr:hypothetical protein DUNSADRAFT_16208 [Dunaliella salina]|eukprot:KAF5829348.1 hypothetical protein DUNSADRAFT_16208 [Dunaliella salina]
MHRSYDWVKLKPDYTKLQEIDALVIGATYGTGELRGGKLSEFLVALRVDGTEDEHGIPEFGSFVIVGTGLEEAERDVIRDKLDTAGLRPRLDPSTRKDLKNAPSKYRVTGNEVVDCWIEDPMKSVVLEVHGDVRPIVSKASYTGFTLRFPRITRYREDKGPLQCQSIREFETMYEERKKDESERTGNAEKSSEAIRNHRKEMEARKKKRKELIPAAFKPAKLEGVEASSDILAGLKVGFYVKDKGTQDDLHRLVRRMSGEPYINVIEKLDFVLAQKDFYAWELFAKKARKDVLRIDWLLEPEGPNPRLPPRPWHYLYMCPVSRFEGYEWAVRYFTDHHDRHGLPWYQPLGTEGKDLKNLMERLIDNEQYQQALKDQDAASQRLAREREVLLEEGNGGTEQAEGEKQGPKTLDQVILDAERELSGLGQSLPEMSLFRGKVVYVLDMGPEPATHMCSLADNYAQQGQLAAAGAGDKPSGGSAWGRSGVQWGSGCGGAKLLQQLGYTVTQAGKAPSRHSSPDVGTMDDSEGTDAFLSRPALSGAGEGAQFKELPTPDMAGSGIPHLDACGADIVRRMRAREQQLQDMHTMYINNLKLKVEAHGGNVVSQLAKGVTHILLVPQGVCEANLEFINLHISNARAMSTACPFLSQLSCMAMAFLRKLRLISFTYLLTLTMNNFPCL